MADTKLGEIAVYEDDDGKAIWEFEGKVQSDIPLDTEAQDFAGAINELKKLSEEGGGEEWQPPADWPEVPEPGEWEANFLIEIRNRMTFGFSFRDPINGSYGQGKVIIDWGDGIVETYEKSSITSFLTHTYSNTGQFIVRTIADETSCFLYSVGDAGGGNHFLNLLIAKTGKKILLDKQSGHETHGTFGRNDRLFWIKINGNPKMQDYGVFACSSLRRMDLANPMTEIPFYCFRETPLPNGFDFSKIIKIGAGSFIGAGCLEKLSLPECTEIGDYSFQGFRVFDIYAPKCLNIGQTAFSGCQHLKLFSAPACTKVSNGVFSNCFALETVKLAEDCTFGLNCFMNCHSLYPRPDGSTN